MAVLPVRSGPAVQDQRGFVRHAAANPGRLGFASGGVGRSRHPRTGQKIAHGRLPMTQAPGRGGAPAMMDCVGGRVGAMLAMPPFARSRIDAGKARPVAGELRALLRPANTGLDGRRDGPCPAG